MKALPKTTEPRKLPHWKPRIFEAEYRLNAYVDGAGKLQPGFVVAHSCGLSLVLPSPDGEWPDVDVRKGWRLTHTASGKGFGIDFTFQRGVSALLLIADSADWTTTVEELTRTVGARRGSALVRSKYGSGYDRDRATRELRDIDQAPSSGIASEVAA